jgi:hypothetical protein
LLQEEWAEVFPSGLQLSVSDSEAGCAIPLQVDPGLHEVSAVSFCEKRGPGPWRGRVGCTGLVQSVEARCCLIGDLELQDQMLARVASASEGWEGEYNVSSSTPKGAEQVDTRSRGVSTASNLPRGGRSTMASKVAASIS